MGSRGQGDGLAFQSVECASVGPTPVQQELRAWERMKLYVFSTSILIIPTWDLGGFRLQA